MKKATLVLLISSTFILFLPSLAYGCGCGLQPNQTPEQAKAAFLKEFNNAAMVFSGEVVEVNLFEAKFKVEMIWKGEGKDEITMWLMGKNNKGEYVMTSCDFPFRMGGKYLVYGYLEEGKLRTSVCSRTVSMMYAEHRLKELNEITQPQIRNQNTGP
jgi:hypothetical protein